MKIGAGMTTFKALNRYVKSNYTENPIFVNKIFDRLQKIVNPRNEGGLGGVCAENELPLPG